MKKRIKVIFIASILTLLAIGAFAMYLFKSPALDIKNSQYFIVFENDNPETLAKRLESEYGMK
ncbi:MAG: hypothetical protein IT245_01310 [Bacteroidia bacterium]|nr:hypothetical protein [Bacteroidia bacterium]